MNEADSSRRLRITTFGSFSVSVGDEPLSYSSPRAGLMWTLFKYIITNRSTQIPTDRIIEVLWPDDEEIENPLKALYTLMYRLRAELSKLYDDKPDFILFRQNTYLWNKYAPYTLDSEEFETSYMLGGNMSLEPVERLGHYLNAFHLYNGDYLAESSSASWVIPQATYYKRLYTSLVVNICELYKQISDYDSIVKICERAIELDPLEDSHHVLLIEALIKQGQYSQAMAHYDYITLLLYNELGIQPSERLQALYKLIHQSTDDMQYDIESIMDMLAETDSLAPGAFFCDFDVFHKIYQLENRSLERSGSSVYLACFTFSTPSKRIPPNRQLGEAMALLKKIAMFSLRRGDVVTQYSKSQILMLLPSNNDENAAKVAARIKSQFVAQYTGEKMELTESIRPMTAKRLV